MKTTLEYDTDKKLFLEKPSQLLLVFHETKSQIARGEFDIARYANQATGQTNRQILELISQNNVGCQLCIFVNVTLLDRLPDDGSTPETDYGADIQ